MSPGLSLQMSQQTVANRSVLLLGFKSDILGCYYLNEVRTANNSDELSIRYDWHSLDRICFHQEGDLIEWSLWIGGDDVAHHDVRHFARVRLDVFGGERLISCHQSQPLGSSFRSCFRAMQQVPLAHDTDQPPLKVDNRDTADVMFEKSLS